MADVQFTVHGMHCSGCAQSIERRLLSTPGVREASVELGTGIADITYDEGLIDVHSLEKVIESLGFDVLTGLGREA